MQETPVVNSEGAIPLWPAGAPEPDGVSIRAEPILFPFALESAEARGAVVVCPGGGYGGLAPHEGRPIAEMLNRAGFHAFVLRYRVAPHKHPAPLADAQRAIRLVRHHAAAWHVKPAQIGILGFSAGGHLVSTAATHFDAGRPDATDPVERVSCRPDAAILCYPVISFGPFGHHGSMVNLIGENPPEALRQSLTNELQVSAQTPPCFLWHTADDQAVPVENSLVFAEAMGRNKVPFALHVFPHGAHGLGLAEGDPVVGAWPRLCVAWLTSLGF